MGLQATVIRDILHAATTYGTAYDTLREMAGFTQEEISDSNLNVEWEKAARLWDLLADVTENEQIGLTLAEGINFSILGMVGFLMQASKNFEQAIQVYCQYGYMVCPMVSFVYRTDGDTSVIELHQNAMWKSTFPRNARIAIDFVLAGFINFTKVLTARDIYPISVELEFDKIAVAEYTRVLKSNVVFNAPLHRLIYRNEDVQAAVITKDNSLYQMFDQILSQKKSLALQSSCSDSLKHLLLMQFKGQIPTIEEAAAGLNITVRTLQRKLTEEGTSFRAIAGDVKRELAIHLMKNPSSKITEVAGVLGYSDLPAFRRAFKSWTEQTPKEAKRVLQAAFA